jgi:hypothetical protein
VTVTWLKPSAASAPSTLIVSVPGPELIARLVLFANRIGAALSI